MDYKILFIDEEEEEQDKFKDYFERVSPDVNPECLLPEADIDDMLDKIIELQADAIVTDFRLNEIRTHVNYNVNYNGVELIKELRNRYENFPSFVITSHDDEAVNDTDDVNVVYIKDILSPENDKGKVPFAQRIIRQIDKYRSSIDAARNELNVLIDKRSNGEAGVYEENRIIELDSFLERTFGTYDAIPEQMKKLSNIDKLNELIDKADEILKKLE